ncbi:MAG: molybdopterin-dependent oxidoreductase, partial [Thermodesulfovibrionales bacterium]
SAPVPSIPRVDGRGTKYPFAHSSGIYVEARERMIDGYYTDPSNPAKTYPLKAAFFVFQNFVFNTPNSARNIQAIKNMELVVVVDTHMSETALMADYVIPGTTYLERYDINPNWTTFPSVGLRRPVVKPIFGQLPEYDFVIALGKKMHLIDFPETLTYEQYLDDELRNGIGIGLADLMDEKKFPGSVWIGGDTRYQKYATGLWVPDTPPGGLNSDSQELLRRI